MVPWVGDFAPLSTIWTSGTDYLMDNRMHKISKRGWKSPRDTGKRDTRWRDTGRRKSEGPSYISLLPPCLACPCAQSPYALAYFVSPNEGLVEAHGTSGPTKKSRTSLFTNKTCLLTVLCRRDPAWTHLVLWMWNISYWRCPFWVWSATFLWAGETELHILHFLQQFQDESLGLVPPTNIQRYHANNKVATLQSAYLNISRHISHCMQNLSGGQNFPFSMTWPYQICISKCLFSHRTIFPKIRSESRPKIAKSPSLSSSTCDKDIGREEYPLKFVAGYISSVFKL